MLPCSMILCPEEGEGKTALIDQRAVAAGNKLLHFSEPDFAKDINEFVRV